MSSVACIVQNRENCLAVAAWSSDAMELDSGTISSHSRLPVPTPVSVPKTKLAAVSFLLHVS